MLLKNDRYFSIESRKLGSSPELVNLSAAQKRTLRGKGVNSARLFHRGCRELGGVSASRQVRAEKGPV